MPAAAHAGLHGATGDVPSMIGAGVSGSAPPASAAGGPGHAPPRPSSECEGGVDDMSGAAFAEDGAYALRLDTSWNADQEVRRILTEAFEGAGLNGENERAIAPSNELAPDSPLAESPALWPPTAGGPPGSVGPAVARRAGAKGRKPPPLSRGTSYSPTSDPARARRAMKGNRTPRHERRSDIPQVTEQLWQTFALPSALVGSSETSDEDDGLGAAQHQDVRANGVPVDGVSRAPGGGRGAASPDGHAAGAYGPFGERSIVDSLIWANGGNGIGGIGGIGTWSSQSQAQAQQLDVGRYDGQLDGASLGGMPVGVHAGHGGMVPGLGAGLGPSMGMGMGMGAGMGAGMGPDGSVADSFFMRGLALEDDGAQHVMGDGISVPVGVARSQASMVQQQQQHSRSNSGGQGPYAPAWDVRQQPTSSIWGADAYTGGLMGMRGAAPDAQRKNIWASAEPPAQQQPHAAPRGYSWFIPAGPTPSLGPTHAPPTHPLAPHGRGVGTGLEYQFQRMNMGAPGMNPPRGGGVGGPQPQPQPQYGAKLPPGHPGHPAMGGMPPSAPLSHGGHASPAAAHYKQAQMAQMAQLAQLPAQHAQAAQGIPPVGAHPQRAMPPAAVPSDRASHYHHEHEGSFDGGYGGYGDGARQPVGRNANDRPSAVRGKQKPAPLSLTGGANAYGMPRGDRGGGGADYFEGGDSDQEDPQAGLDDDSVGVNGRLRDVLKAMKQKEDAFEATVVFATQSLEGLSERAKWRLCLEVADLAKRENRIRMARGFYAIACSLHPRAVQGWLEWAKMEEECGEMIRCQRVLEAGLSFCPGNDGIMVKAVKQAERVGDLAGARAILGRLSSMDPDRTWRVMLEGALFEARAGNVEVAREVFKYLMGTVYWYGPIYYEAFRFEEKCEEYDRALAIIRAGLREIPRYGPLWFGALRLGERLGCANGTCDLSEVHATVSRAVNAISKELVWRVWFEAAQAEERAENLDRSRACYALAALHSPANLRWRVWVAGARTELVAGNAQAARELLQRALTEVPLKNRAAVLLDCARLEEYLGNVDRAREILAKARRETKHEWKVFLESLLLEVRAGNLQAATEQAERALAVHSGTGRLWAMLIQLKQSEGEQIQLEMFHAALREVPKSGEVWCEGARIKLNPLSPAFDPAAARRFLDFAIQFTPQYGDSFIEAMRLQLIECGADVDTSRLEQLCVNADPNYGTLWFHCKPHPLDGARQTLRNARRILQRELYEHRAVYQRAALRLVSPSAPLPATEPASVPGAPLAPVAPVVAGPAPLPVADPTRPGEYYRPSDFACGLMELCRSQPPEPAVAGSKRAAEQRMREIFGSDSIP